MEFITLDNDKIKKYHVTINKDKLKDLKFFFKIEGIKIDDENGVVKMKEDSGDKFSYSYLTNLIDRLLNDDNSCIDEIFSYSNTYDYKISDIETEVQGLRDELEDVNLNIDDKLIKIDRLKELLEKKKQLDENIKLKKYYNDVQQQIHFQLVDEMNYEEFKKVVDFIGLDYKLNNNNITNKKR